jgi:hypothetical protein
MKNKFLILCAVFFAIFAFVGCQRKEANGAGDTKHHLESFEKALSPEAKKMYNELDGAEKKEAANLSTFPICDEESGKCSVKEGKMDPDSAVKEVHEKKTDTSSKARTENGGYHYHIEKGNRE